MIQPRRFQSWVRALVGAGVLAAGIPALAAPPEPPEPADKPHEHHADADFNSSTWSHAWRPAIALQYGWVDPSRHDFGGTFGDAGQLDLRLGYGRERQLTDAEDLVAQRYHGLVVSRFATQLASSGLAPKEVGFDIWRFGFGMASGAGYRLGGRDVRLVLQTADTGAWYTTDLEGSGVHHLAPADSAILARYDNATRFGDSWEADLRLCFGPSLSVQAGYERTLVLPGFKTWYYLLSNGIDIVAVAIADEFVKAIAENSPHAAPVVGFLLRSGIEYGFYELRQEEMNWPFDTEAPLALDSFKLGFGVSF